MSFSGLFIRGLLEEVRPELAQVKIDKVYNYQNEFHFYLRSASGKQVLVISTDSRAYRLQVLQAKPEVTYPEKPSNFCMLLRRYLIGLPISSIEQPGLERIITFVFSAGYSPDLRPRKYRLICELMGKNSNVILCDPDGFILGAARLSSGEKNTFREVMPGAEYLAPPAKSGHDLFAIDSAYFRRTILLAPPNEALDQILVRTVQGLDLLIAQDILHRSELTGQQTRAALKDYQLPHLWAQVEQLRLRVSADKWAPGLVIGAAGRPTEFSPVALASANLQLQPSFSALQEVFYQDVYRRQEVTINTGALVEALKRELKKSRRKASAQEQDFASAEEGETYKAKADLLMAYLHQVKPGSESVSLPAFADNTLVKIDLDPSKRPIANAESYYARYAKAKRKRERSLAELQKTREHLSYLEQLQEDLRQQETAHDLGALVAEFEALGIIKDGQKPRKQAKTPKGPQYKVVALADGTEILVGRNSKQNDYVTMVKAKPDDLWFHVKNQPGSHVILPVAPNQPPSDTSVLYAARLAATYSKAYQNNKVEVDYTQRKNVWKPKGAKPGMVLYEHYQTIIAEPLDPDALR